MIDYTKVNNLPVSVGEILANELLTFPLSNVATTGEILNRAQVAHFGNMDFVVKGAYVKLKGSYQKHAQGGTNYQDFTFPDVQRVIEELVNEFQFDPKDAYLNFIEIGINIKVSTDPTNLIMNFLQYRHKEFESLSLSGKGYGRKCEFQRMTIKVYNKSLQYGLPFNLLRFEVKVTRMEFLKQYGIENLTMDDLKSPEVYSKLLKMLLNVFDRILLFNPDMDIGSIHDSKDRDLVLQGRFPEYWKELPRQRKSENIKRFKELNGSNNLKSELADLISAKWNELMNPDKLTTFNAEPTFDNSDKLTTLPLKYREPLPDKLTTFKKNQSNRIIESNGQINTTINDYSRICPVSKVDISMQKKESRFLSAVGLLWLRDNDLEKYNALRKHFLPRSGVSGQRTKHETNEFDHLAKQIRNSYHNQRRHHHKSSELQYSFFELDERSIF